MGFKGQLLAGVLLVVLSCATVAHADIDCSTVTSLISNCSNFITYGSPNPAVGSPCCDAVESLNNMADSSNNRGSVCRCLMGLITTYNPNARAIANLPSLCGIALGFTIDPNTDCNNIP